MQEAEAGRIVVERVSQEKIRFTNSSADEPETDLEMLTRVVAEKDFHHLQKGTKRALLAGRGRYNRQVSGQRWKPKLPLGPGAWFLRALVFVGYPLANCSEKTQIFHEKHRKIECFLLVS